MAVKRLHYCSKQEKDFSKKTKTLKETEKKYCARKPFKYKLDPSRKANNIRAKTTKKVKKKHYIKKPLIYKLLYAGISEY